MSRAPAAAALLVCAVFSAPAADKDPWIKITSPSFEVFTTAGERAGRDLVKHFERVHSFFVQRFGPGVVDSRQARVILFRTEKEYQAYRPNEVASAFYHAGEYHDYIVMNGSASDWRNTAVHELTHLMIHEFGQDLPLWFNEGLAELYSNLEPSGSRIMVGRDLPDRMRTLATGEPIALPALLAADHSSPVYNEKSRAPMFYAESWKLVHMLHLHPDYGPHLREFVLALGTGAQADAFRAAYGKSLEAVERDLSAYLKGNTIGALLFDIQMPKSIDDPQVEANAALSSRLAIGEMLSDMAGRALQARDVYVSMVHDYPDRWEVEEAMGMFAWHERRFDDAIRHFARAEELGCRNPATFLLWGRVLGYANRRRESVEILGKAVRMTPRNPEARREYGSALIANGDWADAVDVLRAVDPASVPAGAVWRYWYNLAYGLYKTGNPEAALALVARARSAAANSRELSSLDQLERALGRSPDGGTAPVATAVEGVLENLECGKLARLHVRTGDTVKVFVMPDPRAITIASPGGQRVDLQCGPQKTPVPLRIEYQALPNSGTDGLVRVLEFK